MSHHIYADGFTRVTLSNNNLRIILTQNGPDQSQEDVATLILPANMAHAFINGLTSTLKQLEDQIQAQREVAGKVQ